MAIIGKEVARFLSDVSNKQNKKRKEEKNKIMVRLISENSLIVLTRNHFKKHFTKKKTKMSFCNKQMQNIIQSKGSADSTAKKYVEFFLKFFFSRELKVRFSSKFYKNIFYKKLNLTITK